MKTRIVVCLFMLFGCCTKIQAQLEKVIHQTFEIDEAVNIALDLVGTYEIELWAGNNILTETKIQMFNASPAILNHFVKEKRYEIQLDANASGIKLYSFDKERRAIKYKEGECAEIVNVRIFVPEDFEKIDKAHLVRKAKVVKVKNNDEE